MQHFWFGYETMDILVDCYDMQEYKKACTHPTIIHYTSINKPWKRCKGRFYDEWDKYRKIAEKKVYGSPLIKDGTYTIFSLLDKNKVLDIEGASNKNKANLQLWTRDDTNAQKFKFTYIGKGHYEIESCRSKKVLGVECSKNRKETNVFQSSARNCDDQKWIIRDDGKGCYYIISKCNGLYLDVNGAKTIDGTNICARKFNGSNAQKFKILVSNKL